MDEILKYRQQYEYFSIFAQKLKQKNHEGISS